MGCRSRKGGPRRAGGSTGAWGLHRFPEGLHRFLADPEQRQAAPAMTARLSDLPNPENTLLIKILTQGSGTGHQLAPRTGSALNRRQLGGCGSSGDI